MSELMLLVKRVGIDKGWKFAPYTIASEDAGLRIVDWLSNAWGVALEYRIAKTIDYPDMRVPNVKAP